MLELGAYALEFVLLPGAGAYAGKLLRLVPVQKVGVRRATRESEGEPNYLTRR